MSFGFSYTQNRQVAVYIPFQLYFAKDRLWMYGELGYYRYVYNYYGLGSCFDKIDEEKYSVDFPRVRISSLFRISTSSYVGLRYVRDDFTYTQYDTLGELFTKNILGSKNGTVSGMGFLFNYDTRDIPQFPKKGMLVESMIYIEDKYTGSDFSYQKFSIDASYYLSLNRYRSVLALQLIIIYLTGEVPFHQLAQLGGPKRLRGYFEGRFRNKQLELLQAEFRIPLFWRIKGVIFSGLGTIHNGFHSNNDFCLVANYGLGLRIEIDRSQQLHIRLDYGFGQSENGFYLTLGEAF
jgi:outer membrane protein assembly factor BamA